METKEIIDLLAKHERVIGKLYEVYEGCFPEEAIWPQLSKEEELHAQWLLSFFENVYEGKISTTEKFEPAAIWQSIRRVEQLTADAKSHTLKEALLYALAIEEMVLEQQFMDIFDESAPEVQEVLLKVIGGTSSHRARIQDRLNNDLSEAKED